MNLERISLTIPSDLLKELDEFLEKSKYASRSEAIRDALRSFLIEQKLRKELEGEIVGVLAFLYDHEVKGISDELTDIQHESKSSIASSLHLHIDERNCLEVLLVCGKVKDINKLASRIESMRGVKQLKLIPFMR
ncbi:MAG: nickel-responsive transcriptional regulator NikR [Candidatus Hadarchaeales archaeon]